MPLLIDQLKRKCRGGECDVSQRDEQLSSISSIKLYGSITGKDGRQSASAAR